MVRFVWIALPLFIWTSAQNSFWVRGAISDKFYQKYHFCVYILPLTNIFQMDYFVKFRGESPLAPLYKILKIASLKLWHHSVDSIIFQVRIWGKLILVNCIGQTDWNWTLSLSHDVRWKQVTQISEIIR